MKHLLAILAATFTATAASYAVSMTVSNDPWVITAAGDAPDTFTFDLMVAGTDGAVGISATGGYLSFTGKILGTNTSEGSQPYPTEGNFLTLGANETAVLTFEQDQKGFSFLWGSVDVYNSVKFYLDGVLQYTSATPGATYAQVQYTDLIFDEVRFQSPHVAFEFDNLKSTPVPDGGATIGLLGLALLAFLPMARRMQAV